ncbi:MAG: SDR family oxidoreductase [Spirochaetales bacterium]|nr:SDR family oxidoreductase [Spirochaetales bacterium]
MNINREAGEFLKLEGKTAVITGGGVNIGREISRSLASLGVKVAIVYNSSSAGAFLTVEEIEAAGGIAKAFQADVSSGPEVEKLFDALCGDEQFGRVDILINNSGIFSSYDQIDLPEEEWEKIFNINTKGTFLCAREAARRMKNQLSLEGAKSRGTIINMASINAIHPGFGQTVHYDASKGAVLAFTRSLAAELGPHAIRVNAVAPGLVDSKGLREGAGELAKRVEKRNPLNQIDGTSPLVTAGDVANTVIYLASNLSSAVTGEMVVTDRGYLLT